MYSSLDTLEDIVLKPSSPTVTPTQRNYQKRCEAKTLTNSIVFKLVDVKDSKLIDGYWDSYHCSKTIAQDGGVLRSTYCNRKWCVVCGRIKTMKAIKGYLPQLETFEQPHLVTLTSRNVSGEYLPQEIKRFSQTWKKIWKWFYNHNIEFKGVRKIECTWQRKGGTYNPHYHIIVDGSMQGQKVIELWLKYMNGDAGAKGQHCTPITKIDGDISGGLMEVFKYSAKVIVEGHAVPAKSLDCIYTSLHGAKTLQGFGKVKCVNTEVDKLDAQNQDFKPPQMEVWEWEKEARDWVSSQGETLTDYKPDKDTERTLKILEDGTDVKHQNKQERQEYVNDDNPRGENNLFRGRENHFKGIFDQERYNIPKPKESVLKQLRLDIDNTTMNRKKKGINPLNDVVYFDLTKLNIGSDSSDSDWIGFGGVEKQQNPTSKKDKRKIKPKS